MTDPIADMLTRIKNALKVKKGETLIPYSNVKFAIAKILEKEELVKRVEKVESSKKNKFSEIKIILKYQDGIPAIDSLRRISKPGCRIYKKVKNTKIKKYKISIISTSRGIMTDLEAKKKKLGGEVLCEIC